MFYLFKYTLIITEISVLAGVDIMWILGGIRKRLGGDWVLGSYSGNIVYFVLFKV